MTIGECRSTFAKWLLLPDLTVVDVNLAVVGSSHLPGEPCWLHDVGAPSTGKTEIITAVSDHPSVYAISELTPAGLVSGINSEDGEDHSLLPHLHGRTLAIKDFTPIIDAPKEVRNKLFGRLRDAFDGSQTIHNAMVGTRTHKATFNFLTGVTGAIEKVWRNTSLGERYLLYRNQAGDPLLTARRALDGASSKHQMRQELKDAACGVLTGINYDVVPGCSDSLKNGIVKLAAFLAKARKFMERDRDHTILPTYETEGPSRVAQQLFKLGQGLALINRRSAINDDDLAILRRVAMDSIPRVRRQLIDILIDCKPGKRLLTQRFRNETGLSQSVIHSRLEELCLLDIAEIRKVKVKDGKQNSYKLTDEFRSLLE